MITPTDPAPIGVTPLLSLLRLSSPALPVGAYSYSQGLEYAVEAGWVSDRQSAACWIKGSLETGLARLDIPVLLRLLRAWHDTDDTTLWYWSRMLLASRESAELRGEDAAMGAALARLLRDLGIDHAERLCDRAAPVSYALAYALACSAWQIDEQSAAAGYAWAWCENQVAAAIKLVPLGQTAGQRLLSTLIETIQHIHQKAMRVSDDQVGAGLPGLAISSALHETQYSRLFRS
ncbi:MAG: urease accessory protein UreF [Pseudomonadota bacterium]|nr:urease accessory protein UreF [Pseudomonadota bacterium]